MQLELYISAKCFLCRWIEPRLRELLAGRGLELTVFKVKGTIARQVNGTDMRVLKTGEIPAVPALRVGRVLLVGTGMLGALRGALKGMNDG